MTEKLTMPDLPTIFVSYAREDSDVALKLSRDLKAAGAQIWLDQLDIPPGERWDRAVEAALERSKCLLVVLSPRSVSSENVMDEVSYAIDEKKEIVPVIVEQCKLPLRMRRLQFIDFTTDYSASLKKLLAIIAGGGDWEEKQAEQATTSALQHAPKDTAARSDNLSPPTASDPDKVSVLDKLSSIVKKVVAYRGHTIEIRHFGMITVWYDGKEVTTEKSKKSVFSTSVTHTFRMVEDGRQALYEITWGPRWHGMEYWHEVKRDGEVIFSDH
jgi:hypothetical protein